MDKSRILFFLLLAFLGGIFIGSFFHASGTFFWAGLFACAVLVAIKPRGAHLFWVFLGLFFIFGMARYDSFASKRQFLPGLAGSAENNLFGYISDEPEIKGDKQQFIFQVKRIEINGRTIPVDEKLMVTARLYPLYEYGQELEVAGKLSLPKNSQDFDYRSYLAKDGIFVLSYYPEISENNLALTNYESAKIYFFKKIFKIKNAFESSINRSVHQPNSAFLSGILLGSRSQIPEEIKDAFSRTGTSHILAVSGFNITIIASIISSFLLIFLRRQTAFWFSALAVIIFTIMTGAQASVVRASVMGILVLLAGREGRISDPRNAIVLAGAAMVFFSPGILRYDIGFQLSFAATLGLIYVAPLLERYFKVMPGVFEFRETALMTVSAQVLVLPLLIYYFKNISLISLPVNLIVLPLVPLAMALGFLTGIFGMILPLLGRFFGAFAWLIAQIQLGFVKIAGGLSWAAAPVQFNWYALVFSYAIIITVLVWLAAKNKNVQKL